tara:strand:- start:75 stop:305 length:231 start_codon:yes stop_codon:yes gene_type:complete
VKIEKYHITNKQDSENYIVELKDKVEVRHWIINHLDLSKDWHIEKYVSSEIFEEIKKDMDDFFNYMDNEVYGNGGK